ncbi:MAG: LysM peptidoglycan-binding domain-containing protein [Lachnospiraceae bacterium]
MGELYNPYPKLPKNIRQVGERDQILKLYVEDYVNTYLKRLYPTGGQDLRVGLLLGELRSQDGLTYIMADGAMELEDVAQEDGKLMFHEDIWQKAYQTIEQMFPRRVVVGWFLCGAPDSNLSPLNYWKQHSQYFSGKHQLMYLNSGLEGEEAIYIASEDGFYKLRGYCIYYERNQMMQDYMVCRKDARRVESGNQDVVIQDFRKRMDNKKQEIKKRNSTVSMLGTACGVLTVLVLASGVVTFNNYQKMKAMESVIASAVPEGSAKEWALSLTRGGDTDDGEMEFEEVSGDVYPTRAAIVIETESPTAEAAAPAETESPAAVPEQPQTQAAVPVQVPANAVSYIVQDGETLYGICISQYQSLRNLQTICEWNGLEDENRISAGQQLMIPPTE